MRSLLSLRKMVKDCLSDQLSPKNKSYIHTVSKLNYEEVVKTLNSLQTNASLLHEYKKRGQSNHTVQVQNLEQTVKYLTRSGVSLEQLDSLSVIHVSGTKGKGSTCAFCESILRHHGYKTGFYSSPHLVAARERIRINGRPLLQDVFTEYFWDVYNKLLAEKENEEDMPPYFKFLTVMAYNVFLAEKVDVAIVEVGIGGEYDCTNILRKVEAVGISSLGLDHTSLLGNSIEAIAWQKAGIMKPGAVAITVQQPQEALKVLRTRAVEKQCLLVMAPLLENYDWGCEFTELRLSASVHALNASLAMQLANVWMLRQKGTLPLPVALSTPLTSPPTALNGCKSHSESTSIPIAPIFPVSPNTLLGLKQCSWPGRTQVMCREAADYFLDGAHTAESIEMCAGWFQRASTELAKGKPVVRVLLFNMTGDRDATQLLSSLLACHFHVAIFCPNLITTTVDATSDQANFMVSMKSQQVRCEDNREAWLGLQEKIMRHHGEPPILTKVRLCACVSEALALAEAQTDGRAHVLVTGSLHLVGTVLKVLDPELATPMHQLVTDTDPHRTASINNGLA